VDLGIVAVCTSDFLPVGIDIVRPRSVAILFGEHLIAEVDIFRPGAADVFLNAFPIAAGDVSRDSIIEIDERSPATSEFPGLYLLTSEPVEGRSANDCNQAARRCADALELERYGVIRRSWGVFKIDQHSVVSSGKLAVLPERSSESGDERAYLIATEWSDAAHEPRHLTTTCSR